MSKPKTSAVLAAAAKVGAAAATADSAADAGNAEFAATSDPQPGETTGPVGAEVQPISATHVDARVLAECEFGKPNDLASVPAERVAELEGAFVIDTNPAAVDFARRLAAGDIEA